MNIDKRRLARGIRAEAEEHGKWATKSQLRRIATDHIIENPKAYPARKK